MRVLAKPGWGAWVWALALAIWIFVPFAKFASSWQGRAIGVALAIAFCGGLALAIRSAFRRVVARPARRGIDRWLMRLPAWVSAPLIVCAYMAVPVVIGGGMAWDFHRFPFMAQWMLGGWLVNACGFGGFWTLAWREQRKYQALAAGS
jgi:hypothetical protein